MGRICKLHGMFLSRYADRTLPASTQAAIERHLGVCPACQHRLAQYRLLDQILVAPAPIEAAPYLWTRTRQQLADLRGQEPKGIFARLRPVLVPVAGAALAVLALVLGLQVNQTIDRTSRQVEIQAINLEPEEGSVPASQPQLPEEYTLDLQE